MCLTGGFVLSMMIEPSVAAPVICQPALPLVTPVRLGFDSARRGALGVSYRDLIDAKQRHAEGVGLLGMRYSTDKICPRERMDRLEREFPNMKRIELPATDPKHSTLTHDFSQLAYDELLKFLRGNLLQKPSGWETQPDRALQSDGWMACGCCEHRVAMAVRGKRL